MRLMAFEETVKGGVYIYPRVIPSFIPSFYSVIHFIGHGVRYDRRLFISRSLATAPHRAYRSVEEPDTSKGSE